MSQSTNKNPLSPILDQFKRTDVDKMPLPSLLAVLYDTPTLRLKLSSGRTLINSGLSTAEGSRRGRLEINPIVLVPVTALK